MKLNRCILKYFFNQISFDRHLIRNIINLIELNIFGFWEFLYFNCATAAPFIYRFWFFYMMERCWYQLVNFVGYQNSLIFGAFMLKVSNWPLFSKMCSMSNYDSYFYFYFLILHCHSRVNFVLPHLGVSF